MIIDDSMDAKIIDFGLAVLDWPLYLGDTEKIVGKPQHIAPETIRHGHYCPLSDQYAFGISMFYEIMQRAPFTTGNIPMIFSDKLMFEFADCDPLEAVGNGYPRKLAHIIKRCTMKDYKERFENMAEVAYELEKLRRRMG